MFNSPITEIKQRIAAIRAERAVRRAGAPPPVPGVQHREWKYLRQRDLSSLRNLYFESRKIVEGSYAGRHRSPLKGSAPEFVDYRQYHPGDELRTVDWKVFARTDRYFVRRFEQETNLNCSILLDASASMAYRGVAASGRPKNKADSKFDYAAHLCAALAFLILKQGDSAGLTLFDADVRAHVPPAGRYPHLYTLLRTLEGAKPGRRTSLAAALRTSHGVIRRRGLLVVISDLLDDPEEITKVLGLFTHRGFEILIFHVLHEDELRLPAIESAVFLDSESGEELTCAPEDLRSAYSRRITAFREDWIMRARARGIEYQFVTTATPYAEALGHYLVRRGKV